MADRSITHSVGILEDVPVKLGNFYLPIDFVVLDIPADYPVPIILGRPFLATSCCNERGDQVEFAILAAMKGEPLKDDIFNIYDEEESRELVSSILINDPLERVISFSLMEEGIDASCDADIQSLKALEEDLGAKIEKLI